MKILNQLLEQVRNDASGAALLKDWLGAGGVPIEQVQAELRADVCYRGNNGAPCPLNKEPNWWQRFANTIALTIRRQLELKRRLGLRVQKEHHIHMCAACGCCLKLKVWVPIQHIGNHTSVETFNKFPPYCWQKTEMEALH